MNAENVNQENLNVESPDCVPVYPAKPFHNIALTFSGGGFRAASFSLGVLSYLHRVHFQDENDKLIHHVRFITSTSGGSITNGFYSASVFKDDPFEFGKFYTDLRNAMDGETLLTTVFNILKDEKQWVEKGVLKENGKDIEIRKPRNLINAFAKAYDQVLFKGKTLHCIYSCGRHTHLEETCFNTTEFNNGMSFYIQVNGKDPRIAPRGNGYLKFKDPDIIRHLKISDLVASSSCFPGGFEPVVYPNDFVHEGLTDVNKMLGAIDYGHNNALELDKVRNRPFSLMDGGIADNMGIRSVMLEDAERIRQKKGQFDLILACDVTSYFNEPLPEVKANKKDGGFSISTIITIFKLSIVLFLLCLVSIFFNIWPTVGYLLLIPSLAMSVIYLLGRSWLTRKRDSENGAVVRTALKHIDYFLKLPFPVLMPMLKARANSTVQLISDLFLKQIRRGQYDNLFTKPRLVHRTISCLVYEFTDAHAATRLRVLGGKDRVWWNSVQDKLMPSPEMQKVANEARTMGTTLWFDERDMGEGKKNKLIATGQFTVCYNLIKHICRLELLDPKYKTDAALQDLKQRLFRDFEAFKKNPLFMLDDLYAQESVS